MLVNRASSKFLFKILHVFGWFKTTATSITRVTYPERLSMRFEHEGEPNRLPSVDEFVIAADALKEPPIITANTVLSVFSVDYQVEKFSCDVSDNSASMLIF